MSGEIYMRELLLRLLANNVAKSIEYRRTSDVDVADDVAKCTEYHKMRKVDFAGGVAILNSRQIYVFTINKNLLARNIQHNERP